MHAAQTLATSEHTFHGYDTEAFYDELFEADGQPREGARVLVEKINALLPGELKQRQEAIDRSLLRMGITFTVYGDNHGTEKIFPFDIIPRIVAAEEWQYIESGLKQRIEALNRFLGDIYHAKEIVRAGIIPENLLAKAKSYRKQCEGLNPPRGIWCHITGTDLIRHSDGKIYVLEDNLRCPSGVSYVLQNRMVMKSSFPLAFKDSRVRPVDDYASHLYETLVNLAPSASHAPTIVVMTPGSTTRLITSMRSLRSKWEWNSLKVAIWSSKTGSSICVRPMDSSVST